MNEGQGICYKNGVETRNIAFFPEKHYQSKNLNAINLVFLSHVLKVCRKTLKNMKHHNFSLVLPVVLPH